ncbi:MAG: archease [Sulfurimonadaceae bacterium]|nr:archease [Sulfurimonadaceae bacterium]
MDAYSYFEHDADIGIIGRGHSVEEAFESAAKAVFAIVSETVPEDPEQEVVFEFDEEDVEYALVRWLNFLIAYAQSDHLLLSCFELTREGKHWLGRAWGSPWHETMKRGVEVKGATLTMLSVAEKEGLWEARCIVDV